MLCQMQHACPSAAHPAACLPAVSLCRTKCVCLPACLPAGETALRPPVLLSNLLTVVPELRQFAQLEVKVVMNKAREKERKQLLLSCWRCCTQCCVCCCSSRVLTALLASCAVLCLT